MINEALRLYPPAHAVTREVGTLDKPTGITVSGVALVGVGTLPLTGGEWACLPSTHAGPALNARGARAGLGGVGGAAVHSLQAAAPHWGVHASPQVAGIDLPYRMTVMVPIWAMHRDPTLWPRAEEFLPERWLPEVSRWAWLGGPAGVCVCAACINGTGHRPRQAGRISREED